MTTAPQSPEATSTAGFATPPANAPFGITGNQQIYHLRRGMTNTGLCGVNPVSLIKGTSSPKLAGRTLCGRCKRIAGMNDYEPPNATGAVGPDEAVFLAPAPDQPYGTLGSHVYHLRRGSHRKSVCGQSLTVLLAPDKVPHHTTFCRRCKMIAEAYDYDRPLPRHELPPPGATKPARIEFWDEGHPAAPQPGTINPNHGGAGGRGVRRSAGTWSPPKSFLPPQPTADQHPVMSVPAAQRNFHDWLDVLATTDPSTASAHALVDIARSLSVLAKHAELSAK